MNKFVLCDVGRRLLQLVTPAEGWVDNTSNAVTDIKR
jgi:hypothetical protein